MQNREKSLSLATLCGGGGVSLDGARMIVFAASPLEKYVGYAKKVGGIEEDVPEAGK